MGHDLGVLYEHPSWQEPLFAALTARGIDYRAIDLKKSAFEAGRAPSCCLYFNQASPSAYLRGNTRAVPLALALLENLESAGADVINGARAFRTELSKSAQIGLMASLGIEHPRTITFNDPVALEELGDWSFPSLVKPEQGGSGARMFVVESLAQLLKNLETEPELWLPDNLLLLQELLEPVHPESGIVRLEYVAGRLLYGLRVVGGDFNLCPSDICHPESQDDDGPRFELETAPDAQTVADGSRLLAAGGIDIGAVEYMETHDGRRVVYDVNANSNLRRSLAPRLGFDPIERVVDLLENRLATGTRQLAAAFGKAASPHPRG